MTDDEKLEGDFSTRMHLKLLIVIPAAGPQVLHKLIPAVLGTLKSPHDATRKKASPFVHVNVCHHVKRVNAPDVMLHVSRLWRSWPTSTSESRAIPHSNSPCLT
eukprot:1158276-Pelagomonas_calceolata.AAC.5